MFPGIFKLSVIPETHLNTTGLIQTMMNKQEEGNYWKNLNPNWALFEPLFDTTQSIKQTHETQKELYMSKAPTAPS